MSGNYEDEQEEDSSLQVTPSFKKGKGKGSSSSRSSKGRGGPAAAAAASDEIRGQAGNGENDGVEDDNGEDTANSSAVLFKRSSKKKGPVGLGAASATRKSTGTTPRSKLNVSFGEGQDGEDAEGADDNGDNASASAVRKSQPTRKLQRPSGLATSSSFVGAADG